MRPHSPRGVSLHSMKQREPIPQTEVLAWLSANHPELFQSAELDREWTWLTASLKPPHPKCECAECAKLAAVRRSLSDYGFVFARRNLHLLPNGKLGTWGHSCLKPLPFHRKRASGAAHTNPIPTTQESADAVRREALA